MNESYSAWKERRGRKTEIRAKLKKNKSHKSVHMVSKWLVRKIDFQKMRDLLNSGKQFIMRKQPFPDVFQNRCP